MIKELQSRVDKIDGFYLALNKQKTDMEQEISTLKKECDLLNKTSLVLKHLLDSMVKDDITKMAGLITYGLKTIFDDQDISFFPYITKKNEKIWVELKTNNHGIEGEFGSFGGSVAVIESFLLRIICIIKMKLAKLMFLDETFAALSEEYVDNTSKLISELSKKLGLDVLLVTQTKEIANHANIMYKVSDSEEGIKIERIK